MPAAALILAVCSWAHPGADPYVGTPAAAIMAKTQIPFATRLKLAERAGRSDYDDAVLIKRDTIEGRHGYDPDISDMAFGEGRRCLSVDRSAWAPTHVEPAMVFCEAGWCVARPAVCNNWAIVRRHDPQPPARTQEVPTGRGFAVADVPEPVEDQVALDLPTEGQPDQWVDQPPVWVSVVYAAPGSPVIALPVPAVPEPGTWALMLTGAALIAWRRRR